MKEHTLPAAAPTGHGSNTIRAYGTTAAEIGLVALVAGQVFTDSLELVGLWEAAALTYLAFGFIVAWRRAGSSSSGTHRVGTLDTLSWVLTFAASAAGVNSAVLVLAQTVRGSRSPLLALVCSIGIITAWLLLHTGFAHIYEGIQHRSPNMVLEFPDSPEPNFADYLYFSFTIGTSFATSDTMVRAPRVRLVVMIHSITGFLYNALVVAIAFQVLQSLVHP
jgi:uncharacterized membrane protein